MAINKVEYNGEVLIDLTEDTVTEETLARGVTAHNGAGELITGTMIGGSVQSDWAQTDETQLDYIKNKPEIKSQAIKDDSSLITSGGVYEAIENGKEIVYIPTELGFNESGMPITATLVGVIHTDILGYIEQGKEPKLKASSELAGVQSALLPLVFQAVDGTLIFQTTMPVEPYYIINIIVTQNDTILQTVQNLNDGSIVDENVDDITKGWDDYIPTVGASKRLISTMTSDILRPFEVVATVDFQNNTLINVEANGQSQTEANIYQLIADAYNKDYHCYISGDLSQEYPGKIGFLQLTVFSSDVAVFEQVIKLYNKYYHMRAEIMPGNIFVFTKTELINEEQIFAEIQRIEEIANGKCQSFVFDTQLKLETEIENYKNNELSEGDILYNIELKIGDVFLIKDTEVPDYWWNGNGISELETTKVFLENYYNKTEIDLKVSALMEYTHVEVSELNASLKPIAKSGSYTDLTNLPRVTKFGNFQNKYYRFGKLPYELNGNNMASFILKGRFGGFLTTQSAYMEIMLMNRSGVSSAVSVLSTAADLNAVFNLFDIIIAEDTTDIDTSSPNGESNPAYIYLVCNGYVAYDFEWMLLSGNNASIKGEYLYTGNDNDEFTLTEEPENVIWRLSTAPKTILKSDGSFEASGGINATTIDGKQLVTSNSAPASGTSENIITLVY